MNQQEDRKMPEVPPEWDQIAPNWWWQKAGDSDVHLKADRDLGWCIEILKDGQSPGTSYFEKDFGIALAAATQEVNALNLNSSQEMSQTEIPCQGERSHGGDVREVSTGAPLAVSGTQDLSNLEAEVLLTELRRRGLVVSAWGIADATGTLENDEATESLTESQFAQLEEKLFEKAADALEDILTNRGNDHINDTWAIHGQKLIAAVLEQDAAPHAPSPGL